MINLPSEELMDQSRIDIGQIYLANVPAFYTVKTTSHRHYHLPPVILSDSRVSWSGVPTQIEVGYIRA